MVNNRFRADGQGVTSHSFFEEVRRGIFRKGRPSERKGSGVSPRVRLHQNIPLVGGEHNVPEGGDPEVPGIENESRGKKGPGLLFEGRRGRRKAESGDLGGHVSSEMEGNGDLQSNTDNASSCGQWQDAHRKSLRSDRSVENGQGERTMGKKCLRRKILFKGEPLPDGKGKDLVSQKQGSEENRFSSCFFHPPIL